MSQEPPSSLEEALQLLDEMKTKLQQKDNEIMTLWEKLEESSVEILENLKLENADLKAKLAELEMAKPAQGGSDNEALTAELKELRTKVAGYEAVFAPAKPPAKREKPAPAAPAIPVKPMKPAPPSPAKMPAAPGARPTKPQKPLPPVPTALFQDLGQMEAPEPESELLPDLDELPAISELPEELPALDEGAPPKELEELLPIEEAAEPEMPETGESAVAEMPEMEELPPIEEEAKAPVPVRAQKAKEAPVRQPVAVQVMRPGAAKPAPQAVAPGGTRVSVLFQQEEIDDPAEFIGQGFEIIASIAKANHSGEEIAANLDAFREKLKTIIGFSQVYFPMTSMVRTLKKSKGPVDDKVLDNLLSNLSDWRMDFVGKLK
jgi:regulator of replication initiation timing